ncbi:MAG: creatininase family protein [Anaerolineales bacterium]|nr:creatininase family protein [Anaerolineales bacterium]
MQYGERRWVETHDMADKVVVLPLGSLEQHGHHLPMLTDSLICAEIIRRAEAQLGGLALFLPLVWTGASEHHNRFAGTVSISQETYTRMLDDILESLIAGGAKRILLLNAHGGNELPGHTALYKAQMRHRDERDLWLVFATWFRLAGPQIAAIPELEQDHVTHACELETSMILRLRPEWVDLPAAQGATVPFESAFYCPDMRQSSRVTISRPIEHVSKTGAFGHPELATDEKGETLFAIAAREVVACIREIAGWEPWPAQ